MHFCENLANLFRRSCGHRRSQSRGTGLSLSLRSSAEMRFGSTRTVPAASLYNFPDLSSCPRSFALRSSEPSVQAPLLRSAVSRICRLAPTASLYGFPILAYPGWVKLRLYSITFGKVVHAPKKAGLQVKTLAAQNIFDFLPVQFHDMGNLAYF